MYQTTFFPVSKKPNRLPCVRTSATSKAAAEKSAKKAPSQKQMVLDYIRRCGERGATDNQIIEAMVALGMSFNAPRARRVDLTREGKIIEAGTRNGCTIWVAVKP